MLEIPPNRSTLEEEALALPWLKKILKQNDVERDIATHTNVSPDENGMIHSDGEEYRNSKEMRSYIVIAQTIRNSIAAIPKDHTRLWRGNRPKEVGHNPSYTNSLEGIALPLLLSYGGYLTYIDVPNAALNDYLCENCVAQGAEFKLPRELASTATLVGLDPEESKKVLENSSADEEDEIVIPGWGSI